MNEPSDEAGQLSNAVGVVKNLEQLFASVCAVVNDDQNFVQKASEATCTAGVRMHTLLLSGNKSLPGELKEIPTRQAIRISVDKKGNIAKDESCDRRCADLYWFRFVNWYINQSSGTAYLEYPEALVPLRNTVERLPSESLDRLIHEACSGRKLKSNAACDAWVTGVWRALVEISRVICREARHSRNKTVLINSDMSGLRGSDELDERGGGVAKSETDCSDTEQDVFKRGRWYEEITGGEVSNDMLRHAANNKENPLEHRQYGQHRNSPNFYPVCAVKLRWPNEAQKIQCALDKEKSM